MSDPSRSQPLLFRRADPDDGPAVRDLVFSILEERGLGHKRITLETAAVLKEAIALYTSHGFKPYDGEKCSSHCDQTYELEL